MTAPLFSPLWLDRGSTVPLSRQIYEILREEILDGRLRPGQRLGATRSLAAELGVGRNTVVYAFEQLSAEGYLRAEVGSGTFVSERLPEEIFQPPARADRRAPPSAPPALGRIRGGELPTEVHPRADRSRPVRPFRAGVPDLDHFPISRWQSAVSRALREAPIATLDYGDPQGSRSLREVLVDYLRGLRRLECTAEQIFVVGGSQQALDLASRTLTRPGDRVWIENPGYLGARAALLAADTELVPIAVDADGLDVERAIARAPEARLAYVTPTHQFPTGTTLSLPRRLELLDWASRTGAWIIEDDYDSEFRFSGRPLEPLASLDRGERVVHVGSFSKVMFPSLRLGYMVVPEALIETFREARYATDRHRPALEQMALARFIEEGDFARHVRRMRVTYAARRAALKAAVHEQLGRRLVLGGTSAGLHAVGWLPPSVDDRAASVAARSVGITAAPLSSYRLRTDPIAPHEERARGGLVLGYAAFDEERIAAAVERLATALPSTLPPHSPPDDPDLEQR